MPVVYQHVRLDTNQVFYIGIGKEEDRAYDFVGRNEEWNSVTSTCDYRVDIVSELNSIKECREEEKRRIVELSSKGNLTNIQHNSKTNSKKRSPHYRNGSSFMLVRNSPIDKIDGEFKESLYQCLARMTEVIMILNSRIDKLEQRNSLFGRLFNSKN